MKRTSRSVGHALVVVLAAAFTAASTAAVGDRYGPFGLTSVAAPTARTARVGALLMGGRRFCTASVVHSAHRDLVITAAHCLAGHTHDVVFAPGYRDGRTPYGGWRVREWFVPKRWVKGRDEDSDVAFVVVAGRGGEGVEDAVGGNRFVTGAATGATAVTVTGYPNVRPAPVRCTDMPSPLGRTQQRVACPGFSGGTSGSPWIDGLGRVVGVLGGHDNGGSTPDVSYSVVFGAEAGGLYRAAADHRSAGCACVRVGSS